MQVHFSGIHLWTVGFPVSSSALPSAAGPSQRRRFCRGEARGFGEPSLPANQVPEWVGHGWYWDILVNMDLNLD